MPNPEKFRSIGWALCDTTFLARIQIPPGVDLVQSAVSSISYTVTEMIGPQQNIFTATAGLSIPAVVFNTLQADAIWTEDAAGYNFKAVLPGSVFPDVGDYVIKFLFSPSAGGSQVPHIVWHRAQSQA